MRANVVAHLFFGAALSCIVYVTKWHTSKRGNDDVTVGKQQQHLHLQLFALVAGRSAYLRATWQCRFSDNFRVENLWRKQRRTSPDDDNATRANIVFERYSVTSSQSRQHNLIYMSYFVIIFCSLCRWRQNAIVFEYLFHLICAVKQHISDGDIFKWRSHKQVLFTSIDLAAVASTFLFICAEKWPLEKSICADSAKW